jgi:hypothetical protein
LRAAIPEQIDALAQWSEPLVETVDEITGLTRHGFGSGDGPVRLELRGRDGGRLAAYVIARSAHPEVASGSIVVRGQRLATIVRPDRSIRAGSDTLRALLDARPTCDRTLALVAPCDGIVEALDTTGPTMIAVRARDGRLLRLRVHGRRHVDVKVGDPVRAGEALTDGERSHHALLNAWGEERFAEHLLDELEQICGPAVPRVYWELAVRAMLGGPPAARPVLRGFGAMARELRPRRAVR